MEDEAFKDQVIDRLARIEERGTATMTAVSQINNRLCDGDTRMDDITNRLGLVEKAVFDEDTGLATTRKDVQKIKDNYLKTVGMALGAGTVLGLLGDVGLKYVFPSLFQK